MEYLLSHSWTSWVFGVWYDREDKALVFEFGPLQLAVIKKINVTEIP